MKIDSYGLVSLSSEEIFNLIYSKGLVNLKQIYSEPDVANTFNQSKKSNNDCFENIEIYKEPLVDIKAFDLDNQKNWFMPDSYKNLDIIEWLFSQCQREEEIIRVDSEIQLFQHHKMIDLLKFLKYLVDTMKSNNIVWGVGRGSSTASYCLYLIGVHKINSIKYALDIKEFLK